MSNSTSIGRGPAHGSNENHDGDPRNKTLGETASQDEPPVGSGLIGESAPEAPAGAAGARPRPGIGKAAESSPGGPNVGKSGKAGKA